jgi:rRNA processing protein Gar1
LQRIGPVLHISSNGNIILKAENLPRIGDQVVDENLKPVGTVFDIFGLVSSPYIAVRPSVEATSHFIEHALYGVPSAKPRKERRR